MAYEWQSDIIRPDGENGTEVLDTNGVYQPQIEGGDNITIEDGKISASGTFENVQADYTETDSSAPSYIKHKPDLSIYATASGMETELAGKQDVIDDLSTIRSGAEAGSTAVQPGDLAAVATTGSYTSLTNTPQNIVQDASYVHTDNNFTNADKGKLDGIAAGAEVNVQADWSEADPSSDAYIANKPTIPAAQVNSDWNASSGVAQILNKPDLSAYATDSELTDGLATKQDIISDLDSIRAGAAAGATAAQPSDLPSSDELVPSSTSVDAGKVLSVDASGNPEWITPSGGTTFEPDKGLQLVNGKLSVKTGTYSGITNNMDGDGIVAIVRANNSLSVDNSGVYVTNPLPASEQADAGKVLTVNSSGNAEWATQSTVTVDQTYNASSSNAQSGTAVAGAVSGIRQVPASTSSDEDKVLTVNSSGEPVWAASSIPASKPLVAGSNITITDGANDVTIAATVPSVDQTYDASSANAQSGVAVASAISGINAVPASTSADQDKVLTVNSSGTPVWATAQGGGGGSGGDSEFPYDPGYMHTGWNEMIVRFGDTTYDPTTKSSASKFASIVPMNEPGVYKYIFSTSSQDAFIFRSEWNDITNNPVDILQLTSNSSNTGGYYTNLFYGCTGLRSVWNMRGEFGYIGSWFYGCENLEIVSGKIPERYASNEAYYSSSIFVIVGELSSTFSACSSLKRIELIIDANRANLTRACGSCPSLEVGPGIFGLVTSLDYTFTGCFKMRRLYGFSDFQNLMKYSPELIDNSSSYGYTLSAQEAFNGCTALRDFNGTSLDLLGPISNLHSMFSGCRALTKVPSIVVASSNVDISSMFDQAVNLTEIPDIDYTKVTNAAYAFSDCKHLIDVNGLIGLATACTNVDGLLLSSWSVRRGCIELYNALSASGSAVTNHDNTFNQTGSASGNDVLSQIPSSWGGTGA